MNLVKNPSENNLSTEQLKKLIVDHSVRENLKALLKQASIIAELASKLRKETAKLIHDQSETIDQLQLLTTLEQLRIAKHYMRGIRFVNFYNALKGETPRSSTTEKFEVEKWLKQQAEREARYKAKLEEEKVQSESKKDES